VAARNAKIAGARRQLDEELALGIGRRIRGHDQAIVRPSLPLRGKNFLASFEAAAVSLGIEPVAMRVYSDAEIETGIAALGAEQAGLVEYSSFLAAHIGTVISSAARHKVPAIYEGTLFASKGGLIAYGASFTDMFRRAAGYADRILRGERPADLPVQTPTKFEMIINLKTAKALGLNVPPSLFATADEVIE
jgi:putative ABC transport system substrate-binding protein